MRGVPIDGPADSGNSLDSVLCEGGWCLPLLVTLAVDDTKRPSGRYTHISPEKGKENQLKTKVVVRLCVCRVSKDKRLAPPAQRISFRRLFRRP